MPALEDALDEIVPKRLTTFDDRGSECWHRVIFGRPVHVDCTYDGYVERTGGIHLDADKGRITGEMPIYATVSARGIGRFVRRLHGSTEARLTVYATARPRLLSDWNVVLDMHEGYRWREPPVVRVLGFPIDLARYAEPAIDRQLVRVKERVTANVRALDVRGKAERVWKQMFTPVKLSDSPGLWLQVTPGSVAFSGLRATGRVLEGSLEISGDAVASVGEEPPSVQSTPLPALGNEVSAPGEFNVAVPVDFTYSAMASAWQKVLASQPEFSSGMLKRLDVSQSQGKIAIVLHLAHNQGPNDAITLVGDPQPGSDGQTINLQGLERMGAAQLPLNLASLGENLKISASDRFDALMASANQSLNQKLENGFRREGHLEIGKPISVAVLPDRLRITTNAHGNLRFVYDR
ncbi:MAG: DUF4403 family protein [Proteobacteria bacterium]|nr:DUF4403 family protein [Pseudomonadota bacterium]